MKRGKTKALSQAEKLLQVLLTGKEVTLEEINSTLVNHIVLSRLSAYLWDLKQIKAEVKRIKNGVKVTALQLVNVADMQSYLDGRLTEAASDAVESVSV